MKKLIVAAAIFVAIGSIAAYNIMFSVNVVPSIAALQALGTASAQYPTVNVQSYYVGLNKGGGIFNWNAASTATADSCTVIAATGVSTGRWIRQLNGPLDITMCGAYADGTHADQAAITQAGVVASALPYKTVTLPGGTILITASITAAQGVSYRGQGMGSPGFNQGGIVSYHGQTWLDGTTMTTGWVFDINTPNGTTQFEAPKYYDMGIAASIGSGVTGGCIRWNNINNGFTDNASSQYYMIHPHAERISCLVNNDSGTNEIGIQCNKCFDGDISQSAIQFGKYGIDLEGSDIISIGGAGPNRVQGSVNCLILLTQRGTFGNKDRVVHNELLYPTDNGQTIPGYVCDNSESGVVDSNHIEGNIAHATAAVSIGGGFNHVVVNNDIDLGAATYWLNVTTNVTNLVATGNGCAGCILQAAGFTGGAGAYFYNSSIPQIITHSGNSANGDLGFPFNSIDGSGIMYSGTAIQTWTPSTPGLSYLQLGQTEIPINNNFVFSSLGSSTTNYLDFRRYGTSNLIGTFNVTAVMWVPTGAATITCQLTDNGSLIGSPIGKSLSNTPSNYTFSFAGSASTDAGVRCWGTVATGSLMSQISLTY